MAVSPAAHPFGRAERLPLRLGSVEADDLSRAAGEYRAVLRAIGPEALRVTDKEPHNFEQLGVIWKAWPDARVIHCRRRPIDICLSIYFNFFNGKMAWDRADLVFQYRQYERLMEHWRDVLPADSSPRSSTRRWSPTGRPRRGVSSPSAAWNGTTPAWRPSETRAESRPRAFGRRGNRSIGRRSSAGAATSPGSESCGSCSRRPNALLMRSRRAEYPRQHYCNLILNACKLRELRQPALIGPMPQRTVGSFKGARRAFCGRRASCPVVACSPPVISLLWPNYLPVIGLFGAHSDFSRNIL